MDGDLIERLECGHPRELAVTSAETGAFLYCELCDCCQRRNDAERMEQEYAAALREKDAEIARLERLVYVPGVTKCAKCSCSLISSTLNAATGQMKANTEPQQCPNGCGPMWRVTERDAGNEVVDRLDAMFARAERAEARVRELEAYIAAMTMQGS